MTTTKILFSGKHLFVNANAEGGQLTVEVLDGSGVTLRGFAADRCIPIRADGTRQMVRWQSSSDLSRLIGIPRTTSFWFAVLTIVGWEARRRIDATPSFR